MNKRTIPRRPGNRAFAFKDSFNLERFKPLSGFFEAISHDARVSVTHIGLYAVLLQCWQEQDFENPVMAFSHEIMDKAKMSARATYLKCLHDLDDMGYIRYEHSYKRNSRSKVFLNFGKIWFFPSPADLLNLMTMEKITFEQLPETVALLLEKVERIETLLLEQPESHTDDLLNIRQAAKFLDLAVATVYSKVCRKELPVNKKGKRIYFYRSELTEWIKKGRKQTLSEIRESVDLAELSQYKKHGRVNPSK